MHGKSDLNVDTQLFKLRYENTTLRNALEVASEAFRVAAVNCTPGHVTDYVAKSHCVDHMKACWKALDKCLKNVRQIRSE